MDSLAAIDLLMVPCLVVDPRDWPASAPKKWEGQEVLTDLLITGLEGCRLPNLYDCTSATASIGKIIVTL